MTCYDCIHCDACSDAGDSGYSLLKEDASKCKPFKNKADFVEVVRCEKCKHFMEYNEDYVGKVEKADGDCYIRKMYSCDPQFCAVKSDDFCSYGERRDT